LIDYFIIQVAQRRCGCPIISSVQSQAGEAFEQNDLVKYVRTLGSRLGTG